MGLLLLRVCTNDQEERAERALSKLAGAAEWQVLDSPEGDGAVPRGLERLEKERG